MMDSYSEQSSLFDSRNPGFVYRSRTASKPRENAGKIRSNQTPKPKQILTNQQIKSAVTSEFSSLKTSICDFRFDLEMANNLENNKSTKRKNAGGIRKNCHSSKKGLKENQESYGKISSTKSKFFDSEAEPSYYTSKFDMGMSKINASAKKQPVIIFDETYKNKLENYQQKKANFMKAHEGSEQSRVLREIDLRLNKSSKTLQKNESNCQLNRSSTLLQKMKNTMKFQNSEIATSEQENQIKKFRDCLYLQIQLENELRTVKAQISHFNKMDVLTEMKKLSKTGKYTQIFYDYDLEQMLTVEFGEYDPIDFLNSKSTSQASNLQETVQKLVKKYQQTINNWETTLYKQHSKICIQRLLENSPSNQRPRNIEISLQEFQVLMKKFMMREIHRKQIYRIFNRIKPMSRSNIIYIFTK